MTRLIAIEEIDEFADVVLASAAEVNETVLESIRGLDERQLEGFVRQILHDPNETPHGPTEIADILTSNVRINGNKKLAAFVLKGKSFKKVSSKEVTHQFAKLRTIPHLDVMIFGALGSIQDDAQRDFVQAARDAESDWLIIDAYSWARLLIARQVICPQDGTRFDDSGKCQQGHPRDDGTTFPHREGPIIVAPRILDLGTDDHRRICPLKIYNSSKYVFYDIIVGITVTSPGLDPAQIRLTAPEPKNEISAQLRGITFSLDIWYMGPGKDMRGRPFFQVFIASLNPGETLTFILENVGPYNASLLQEPIQALAKVAQYGQTPPQMYTLNPRGKLKALYKRAFELLDEGKPLEATALAESALDYAKKNFGEGSFESSDAENSLALLLAKQGKKVEALLHYESALETFEESIGPDHPALAVFLEDMAELCKEMAKHAEAGRLLDRAARIRSKPTTSR